MHYAATKESNNQTVDISICSPIKSCNEVPNECNAVCKWGETAFGCGGTFETQSWDCSEHITRAMDYGFTFIVIKHIILQIDYNF